MKSGLFRIARFLNIHSSLSIGDPGVGILNLICWSRYSICRKDPEINTISASQGTGPWNHPCNIFSAPNPSFCFSVFPNQGFPHVKQSAESTFPCYMVRGLPRLVWPRPLWTMLLIKRLSKLFGLPWIVQSQPLRYTEPTPYSHQQSQNHPVSCRCHICSAVASTVQLSSNLYTPSLLHIPRKFQTSRGHCPSPAKKQTQRSTIQSS